MAASVTPLPRTERIDHDDVIAADIARQVALLERTAPGLRVTIIEKTTDGVLADVFDGYDEGPPERVTFVYAPTRERRRRA
jgi:hypothetical protein